MVDTGVRVRRAKFPSGSSLAIGLAIGLISLIVGVDLFLHPNISSSLLLPFTFGGVGVTILGIFAVPVLLNTLSVPFPLATGGILGLLIVRTFGN